CCTGKSENILKSEYRTASQVKKEDPYTLNKKTGLGIKLCKRILKID
ncbi:hypothetical protein LCGC14_1556630, partial [marine sediment metagenome]